MKSLGEIISTYRQKKGWSLQKLATETKVDTKVIRHLEADEFDRLPTKSLVQGYVQLIALALQIPEETALALLRRDFPNPKNNYHWQPQQLKLNSWKNRLSWSSAQSFLAILIVVVISLLVLIGWKWRQLGRSPQLIVTKPINQAIVSSPVEITGSTSPKAILTINTEIVSLDSQGNFKYQLELPAGERSLVVEATDAQGRQSEVIYFITVE